jgi:hypothetical protein
LIFAEFPTALASLRDAFSSSSPSPVVSLVPRSTTGYRISSLRDDVPERSMDSEINGRMSAASHLTPGSSSHLMPEASHPVAGGRAKRYHRTPIPREFRTPAGVPSDAPHPAMLASLRDAFSLSIPHPVVSLVPRSTTGYRISSLRDDVPQRSMDSEINGRMSAASHLTPGSSSHLMPEASHPVAGGRAKRYHRTPIPRVFRTPAGVPSLAAAQTTLPLTP